MFSPTGGVVGSPVPPPDQEESATADGVSSSSEQVQETPVGSGLHPKNPFRPRPPWLWQRSNPFRCNFTDSRGVQHSAVVTEEPRSQPVGSLPVVSRYQGDVVCWPDSDGRPGSPIIAYVPRGHAISTEPSVSLSELQTQGAIGHEITTDMAEDRERLESPPHQPPAYGFHFQDQLLDSYIPRNYQQPIPRSVPPDYDQYSNGRLEESYSPQSGQMMMFNSLLPSYDSHTSDVLAAFSYGSLNSEIDIAPLSSNSNQAEEEVATPLREQSGLVGNVHAVLARCIHYLEIICNAHSSYEVVQALKKMHTSRCCNQLCEQLTILFDQNLVTSEQVSAIREKSIFTHTVVEWSEIIGFPMISTARSSTELNQARLQAKNIIRLLNLLLQRFGE